MKKAEIILIILSLAVCSAKAQKITLPKLISYITKETDRVADELIHQGYDFTGNKNYPSFQKTVGDENLSISLYRVNEQYVEVCASQKYNSIISSLENEIKVKSKKSLFFYSPWLKNYVTEYLYNNNIYIYVGKGICMTLNLVQMRFIRISNSDLKQSTFLYEK